VRMVIADGADGIEPPQVVAIRGVVSMPGHHIQGRMINRGSPAVAHELGDQLEITVAFLVPGNGRLKITGIGKPVGADGTQVRKPERRAKILTNVATRLPV